MNKGNQLGDGKIWAVGLVFVIVLVGWQIYRGATVKKVGIPGIFEAEFGEKPKEPVRLCMSDDSGYDRPGSDYADPQASDLGAVNVFA